MADRGVDALSVGDNVTILVGELQGTDAEVTDVHLGLGVTVHVDVGDPDERDLYYHLHEVSPRVGEGGEGWEEHGSEAERSDCS